jgi:hypothetical protein
VARFAKRVGDGQRILALSVKQHSMPKDTTQAASPNVVCATVSGWTESGEYVTVDAPNDYEKPRWRNIVGLDGSISYDQVITSSNQN